MTVKKVAPKAKKTTKKMFIPLHDNVLIEKDKVDVEEKTTPGGLVLPSTAKKLPNTALVIAVGPDVTGIKPKDVVVVGKFSGTDVVVDDEEFVVIKSEDVLGIYR